MIDLPKPSKWPGANARLLGSGAGLPVEPLKRLAQFSDKQFERFTLEWANGYLKGQDDAYEVQLRGGSGDKGRDVVAWLDPPSVKPRRSRIYQCKHYASRLGAGTAALEIGKLLFYTFRGDFAAPESYHFVTHLGVTSDFQDHLDDPEKLRTFVKDEWDKRCKTEITKVLDVELEGEFRSFVDAFDFSIFRAKQPLDLLNEHSQTQYHLTVFGAPLIERPPPPTPPSQVAASEAAYIGELLKAISADSGASSISEKDLVAGSTSERLFSRSRLTFYSSEGLRELSRDQMADAAYFSSLLDEFENGLLYLYTDADTTGVKRLKKTVLGAQTLQLGGHVLAVHVNSIDREGMCHQLANSRNVKWCD